jgi:tetratricopeptide (TPR) repeat protein
MNEEHVPNSDSLIPSDSRALAGKPFNLVTRGLELAVRMSPVVVTTEKCEKCGASMGRRRGRFAEYLRCSAYPNCKNIRPLGVGAPSGDIFSDPVRHACIAADNVREYDEALALSKSLVEWYPQSGEAWFLLGNAYAELGVLEEARAAFGKALTFQPQYGLAWNNLGWTYAKVGKQNEAIAAYRQAIALRADHRDAWFNLGVSYQEQRRYDDAISAYSETVRINSKDTNALYALGCIYRLRGELAKARNVVEKLRALDSAKAMELERSL